MHLINPYPEDQKIAEEIVSANSFIARFLKRKIPTAIQNGKRKPDKEEIRFVVNSYRLAIYCRIEDITTSFVALWNLEKYVGCFLLARALLETFAHYVHTAEKIGESKGRVENIEKIIQKNALGSKIIGDVQPLHINDALRALKRLVGAGQVNPQILQELYDDLSEVAHPNGLGILGIYLDFDIDNETITAKTKPKQDLQATLLRRVLQTFSYFELFEYCDDLFDKSLLEI